MWKHINYLTVASALELMCESENMKKGVCVDLLLENIRGWMFLEFIPLVGVKLICKRWWVTGHLYLSPQKCLTLLNLFWLLPVFLVSLFFPLRTSQDSSPSYIFAFHLALMLFFLSKSYLVLFCPVLSILVPLSFSLHPLFQFNFVINFLMQTSFVCSEQLTHCAFSFSLIV